MSGLSMAHTRDEIKALVAGVGNELKRDDGFGPAVIERILEKKLERELKADVMNFGQRLYDLLLKLKDYGVVVVVDAIEGEGKAGDIYLIEIDPSEVEESKPVNLHDPDLKKFIGLAKTLNFTPEKLYVIGCHPEDLSDGIGLSQTLLKKIDVVIDMIKEILAHSP